MLLLENEIMCWSWTQLNATRAEEMPMRKVSLASASELPTSQVQQGLDLLLLAVACVCMMSFFIIDICLPFPCTCEVQYS